MQYLKLQKLYEINCELVKIEVNACCWGKLILMSCSFAITLIIIVWMQGNSREIRAVKPNKCR